MTTAPEATDTETIAPQEKPPSGSAAEELQLTLLGAVRDWWLSLRAAVMRAADIAVLEARLAALNFTLIVIAAVASGLLLATAWIALFAAIVAWFHELGLSWPAALLLMAAINFVLAGAGGYAIYRMSNNLLFKAIRKFIMYGKRDMHGDDDAGSGSAVGNKPPAQ
jgi:hypothetical protein